MTGEQLAERISPLLELLYPHDHAEVCRRLVSLAEEYADRLRRRRMALPTHRTACLITYADGIRRRGETPLHTLAGFLHEHVGDVLSDVHLLPMFPWTSDDGFAVVDHRAVNPALGTWDDVAELADDYAVMFDFVANHTSSSSPWFTGWLARHPAYDGFYIEPRARFRRLAGHPAAHHAALPRLRPSRRVESLGLDHLRRGPGGRERPHTREPSSSSPTCCSATWRRVPPPSGSTPSASCGRSPAPAACTSRRPTPSSSCGAPWWTTSRPVPGC
ncbi:MAG: alpha-amylase family glycosyl hydrolase [Nocardioidaceae bacterium]